MRRAPRASAVALALVLGAPVLAAAQTPINPGAPEAPTVLNPGAPGNQAPPAPQQKAPSPGVVVVGPDGKVVGEPPSSGGIYYVPPSGGTTDANGNTYQGPDTAYTGPVPELHVVRSGDTLWDLCWFYFNDPWQWPKIWSYNAQITNPHWIYPGDLVRLLPRGVFTAVAPTPDPEGSTPKKAPDPVPAPQRRIESSVTTTAFVEKSDLDRSITIEGAIDEKVLLGIGDDVYLSYPKDRPPEVGKRYSIYVPGRAVKSGSAEYGSYVRLLGTVQVLSVKDGKRARGQIVEANQEIERGAKVGPLVTKFRNVPPVAPKVDLQGTIIAMLTRDQLIGDRGEVVFIALGKGSGLEVGNRMYVVRRGDALPSTMSNQIGSDDRRFPARALGEVVIVEVGDRVSIGVVTLSVQEMSIGDLVMMQRPK
jgi:hypothetical protein